MRLIAGRLGGLGAGVHPVDGVGAGGRLRDELERMIAERLGNRVGGGVDGDLKLLVPQPRLLGLDLVVQQIGLVIELESLLPQVQQEHGVEQGADETEEELGYS